MPIYTDTVNTVIALFVCIPTEVLAIRNQHEDNKLLFFGFSPEEAFANSDTLLPNKYGLKRLVTDKIKCRLKSVRE